MRKVYFLRQPIRPEANGLYALKLDPNDSVIHYTDRQSVKHFRIANVILDKVQDKKLLRLIDAYGEACSEAAREDVH